jgi:hypothetical protein
MDVTRAGVNAVSLPALNLGTLESAVVRYSGGDIMSPWMLSGTDMFEEPVMFSRRSGRRAAMSASKLEGYMMCCGEMSGCKESGLTWE